MTIKILLYFFSHPEKKHHLRELANIVNSDAGNLSRHMQPLTKMNLFQYTEIGRLKFFSINKNHPIYKDLKSLILKTEGASNLILSSLKSLKNVSHIFIYGSYAKNQMDASSDIDLMILGAVDSLTVSELIKPVEKKLGREIHYRIMDKTEFDKRLKSKDPFLKSVMNNKKINIIGSI